MFCMMTTANDRHVSPFIYYRNIKFSFDKERNKYSISTPNLRTTLSALRRHLKCERQSWSYLWARWPAVMMTFEALPKQAARREPHQAYVININAKSAAHQASIALIQRGDIMSGSAETITFGNAEGRCCGRTEDDEHTAWRRKNIYHQQYYRRKH